MKTHNFLYKIHKISQKFLVGHSFSFRVIKLEYYCDHKKNLAKEWSFVDDFISGHSSMLRQEFDIYTVHSIFYDGND